MKKYKCPYVGIDYVGYDELKIETCPIEMQYTEELSTCYYSGNEYLKCPIYNLQSKLSQKENKLNAVKEYIYKNSIPIALTSNPPIHKLEFEGDINEVLRILKKVEEENKC